MDNDKIRFFDFENDLVLKKFYPPRVMVCLHNCHVMLGDCAIVFQCCNTVIIEPSYFNCLLLVFCVSF